MTRRYLVPYVGDGTKADVYRPKYLQSDPSGLGRVPCVVVARWSAVSEEPPWFTVDVEAEEAAHAQLAGYWDVMGLGA